MTTAKAMGGGFPMGAMLAREESGGKFRARRPCFDVWRNALACAAALANIEVIKKEKLVKRSQEMGNYLMKKLRELNKDYVLDIREKD